MRLLLCRSAPARPLTPRVRGHVPAASSGLAPRAWSCRVATSRYGGAVAARVAVAPRLSARSPCAGAGGGTAEPVAAAAEEAELVAEELEALEEDEGRRPTDYDRRAHIFEESSRVFRALKQRRDGDACDGGGGGGAGAGATAAETATHEQQQLG